VSATTSGAKKTLSSVRDELRQYRLRYNDDAKIAAQIQGGIGEDKALRRGGTGVRQAIGLLAKAGL